MANTIEAARVVINITTNGNQAAKEVKQVDSGLGKLAKNVALAAVAKAAFDAGKALVDLASRAEETTNKFNVTFSSVQNQADQMAKNLAENFGLSSRASQQLLADTGDLLTGFGFSQQSALELSNQVQTLAVDLASFTNFSGGAEGASQALTKALLGERESMKALGIAITEADIKQLAEDKGIVGELDRQTKAALTLELAMRQSKNAIGDFARSQDSFANQSRVTQALLEDIGVELGNVLLPFVSEATAGFNEFLKSIKNVLQDGAGPLKQVTAIFEVLKAAMEPLFQTIGPAVEDIMNTIGMEFGEAAKEGDLGSKAMQALAAVGQILASVFRVVAVAIQAIIRNIANMVKVIEKAGSVLEDFWQALTGEGSWEDVSDSIQAVGDGFNEYLVDGLQGFQDVISATGEEFLGLGDNIQKTTLDLVSVYDGAMTDLEDRTTEAVGNVNEALEGMGGDTPESKDMSAEEKKKLEDLLAARSEFNQEMQQRLFEQNATEIEILEQKMAEELAMADKLGAEKLAIEEFYANEIEAIRDEQAEAEQQRFEEQLKKGLEVVNNLTSSFLAFSRNVEDAELERLKEQGASEEELDARRKQIARDRAVRERNINFALTAINVAAAIAEALPDPVQVGFAAVTGAAQLATIASTPIPAAEFGGSFMVPPGNPADSGLLRVNEGERVDVTSVKDSGGPMMPSTVILRIGDQEARGVFEQGTQRALDSGKVKINRPEIIGRNRL